MNIIRKGVVVVGEYIVGFVPDYVITLDGDVEYNVELTTPIRMRYVYEDRDGFTCGAEYDFRYMRITEAGVAFGFGSKDDNWLDLCAVEYDDRVAYYVENASKLFGMCERDHDLFEDRTDRAIMVISNGYGYEASMLADSLIKDLFGDIPFRVDPLNSGYGSVLMPGTDYEKASDELARYVSENVVDILSWFVENGGGDSEDTGE